MNEVIFNSGKCFLAVGIVTSIFGIVFCWMTKEKKHKETMAMVGGVGIMQIGVGLVFLTFGVLLEIYVNLVEKL